MVEEKEIVVKRCYIKNGKVVCVVDDKHEEDLSKVKSITMIVESKFKEEGED